MPDIATGGLPNAPAPASYNSPIVDFSPLGKLAESYFKGDQMRRQMALQSAFENGVPKRPDGSIDYGAVSQTLARYGDYSQLTPPEFKQVGQDWLGNQQFGFVDNRNQKITPAAGSGTGAGGVTAAAITDPATGMPLQGEQLLQHLDATDPAAAAGVRGLLAGDISAAGRNLQKLIPLARLVDPTFSQADFASRVATRKSFTSGQDAEKVRAINQALAHAAYASELMAKMPNQKYVPGILNPAIHAYKDATGDEEFQNNRKALINAINALGGELTKAFRGNQAAQAEVEHWRQGLMVTDSPAGLRGGIESAMRLLGGSMDATAEKYNTGMKTQREGVEFLTPRSRAVYEALSSGQPLPKNLSHEGSAALKGSAPTLGAPPSAASAPGQPAPVGGAAPAPSGFAADLAKAQQIIAKDPSKAAAVEAYFRKTYGIVPGGQ